MTHLFIRTLILLLCLPSLSCAQEGRTPPVAPKTQDIPLPPAVELPPPPQPNADVPDRPLTADEAARIALRNQPSLNVARAGVTAAQGRAQQARSGLFPTLGVGTGYTRTETISGSGGGGGGTTGGTGGGSTVTAPGWQASANLRQLLFDFDRTRAQVRQAEAQERGAGAGLTRAEADLVLQVKQAFYAFVQNTRLVTVNESNLRSRQDQLALAQARLNAGLGLPADVVRAQTAVAEAVLNLNLARNNSSQSRVSLALAMGVDPRTPIQAAETGEAAATSDDVNALVVQALRQRPEVVQAQAVLEAAGHGVRAAQAGNAPSLSASLGVSARGTSFPPRNDSVSVGASIQWNPFDAGLTAGRVREARAGVETAEAQLASARQAVTADVAQAYLDLRTAEQRVTTAEAQVANAEESLRLAEGRYRAGVGTFLEITDAQAALLTARTSRVNAQTAVEQARAALARAVGAR